ncbi:ferrochelatase [Actinokineospora guangxiensis]|uniref:Coproporphyrin III ferrochelatase n=1 Tax=Actinokineospora guangxiensis TaxID=1490288 RepID=A0ABW0ENL5_9PSEU
MMADALLWLSFGGPESPADVRPFLENVTRGRGVPPERLDEVEAHYQHFGGVSPINALNKAAIAAVEAALKAEGIDLPVYFGNRNWHPMVEDTVARMAADGVRDALVFPTSAYGGYSACRQYDEDIARAREAVPDAPDLLKLRHFFDHPLFIAAAADAVRAVAPDGDYRLVFTAHSIPESADKAAGPPEEGGHRYSRQVVEASRLVADAVGAPAHDVVWQSRSGPPQVPWLEPDIVDHIEALHADGVTAVVVCPIGFVSDHLEVVWDLDTEAREKADALGMSFARAATPGADPRFAELVVELVREHTAGASPRKLSAVPSAGCSLNGAPCAISCCEPARRPGR